MDLVLQWSHNPVVLTAAIGGVVSLICLALPNTAIIKAARAAADFCRERLGKGTAKAIGNKVDTFADAFKDEANK